MLHLIACRDRLQFIERAVDAELSKPHRQRQWRLLNFLEKERAVYSFAVRVLEDVQNPAQPGENPFSGPGAQQICAPGFYGEERT